jgi:5-methyltetrahydropteroyltriglutamate--homocysteine methyltransferase
MILFNMKLNWTSTVVGSFPYDNSPKNMEKAFLDQINNGVEYPCYPQLVGMVEQFLDPAIENGCGIEKKGNQYYLEGEFKIPSSAFALEYGQFVLDFFKKYPELKEKVKGWKACLTGPFTLAGDIIVSPEVVDGKKPIIYQEPRAIMSPDLVVKLAKMMSIIAAKYSEMGASIISMDDPTLGLIIGKRRIFFHTEDFITETLDTAISTITSNSSLHVCGRVSPKLRDILLNSKVNILDHEFVKGDNEGVFEKSMFNREDKSLAYGVIESNIPYQTDGKVENYVESPALMEKRILAAVDEIGAENLIFKPDCGFGGLKASFGTDMASEIVRRKLKVLSETMKKVKK